MKSKEVNVRVKHNEIIQFVNPDTGKVRTMPNRVNNLPSSKEMHFPGGRFVKFYEESMDYMLKVFKPTELKIVIQMMQMASFNSNSMKPLNDDTSIKELSDTFGIHRNNIKKLLAKLFSHGIYAEFDFAKAPLSFDPSDPTTFDDESKACKYWVLNPFVSFKGKTISSALVDLFSESKLTKYVFEMTK